MKKLTLMGITVGIASLAQAVTVDFTSGGSIVAGNVNGSVVIGGGTVYIYQEIVATLAAGTEITSATLNFNNINLSAGSPAGINNVLYYDLINNKNQGTTTFGAAEANQDYFQNNSPYKTESDQIGSSLQVASPNFPVNKTESWSTSFSAQALADLTADFNNGSFDIGFDPNCPYQVLGSITLTYTTGPVPNIQSTPDQGATVCLLGLSFLGLLVFRRKLCLN